MNIKQSNKFTKKVLTAYMAIEDPRTKELVQQLIKHLHAYVNETKLTQSEWEFIWGTLAEIAKFTDQGRNEFLLLADVLGVSQLIELINNKSPTGAANNALVGPFYRANAPLREKGSSIASDDTAGERVKIFGTVFDIDTKKPIQGVVLDVWQAATNGFYESQDPNQPDMNLRGKYNTDKDGSFELTALIPTPYPVPNDGPVGKLLRIAKRHPNRPAHIHFIVSAPGYETLITQVFVAGDATVDTDVVFTANNSMIGNFIKRKGENYLQYDFHLKPGKSTFPMAPIQ